MSAALTTYRSLLRASRIAFNQDLPTLAAARAEFRAGFERNRDSAAATEDIKKAQEIAEFLKKNVVQGVKNEGEERYKLNIHEHTERGDNESVKRAGQMLREGGGTLGGAGGGCCGGKK